MGLGFRVYGMEFRLQSSGYRAWGSGFRVIGIMEKQLEKKLENEDWAETVLGIVM